MNKTERDSCHIAEQFCEAPAGFRTGQGACLNPDLPAKMPKCFRCDLPVCKMCSSRRKYGDYGRKRLCNSCQEILDGNEKIIRRRWKRIGEKR